MGAGQSNNKEVRKLQLTVHKQDEGIVLRRSVVEHLIAELVGAAGTQFKPKDGGQGSTAFQEAHHAFEVAQVKVMPKLQEVLHFAAHSSKDFKRSDQKPGSEWERLAKNLEIATGQLADAVTSAIRPRPSCAILNPPPYLAHTIDSLKTKYHVNVVEISDADVDACNLEAAVAQCKQLKVHAVIGGTIKLRNVQLYLNKSLGRTTISAEGYRAVNNRLTQRDLHSSYGSSTFYSPKHGEHFGLDELEAQIAEYPVMLKISDIERGEWRINDKDHLAKTIGEIRELKLDERAQKNRDWLLKMMQLIYKDGTDADKEQIDIYTKKPLFMVEQYWSKTQHSKLVIDGFISKGGEFFLCNIAEKISSEDPTSLKALNYVMPPLSLPRGRGNLEVIEARVNAFLKALFDKGVKKTVFKLAVRFDYTKTTTLAPEDIHIGDCVCRFDYTGHRLAKSALRVNWLQQSIEATLFNQHPAGTMWQKYKANQPHNIAISIHLSANDESFISEGKTHKQVFNVEFLKKLVGGARDRDKLRFRAELSEDGKKYAFESDDKFSPEKIIGMAWTPITFYFTAFTSGEALAAEKHIREQSYLIHPKGNQHFEWVNKLAAKESFDIISKTRANSATWSAENGADSSTWSSKKPPSSEF